MKLPLVSALFILLVAVNAGNFPIRDLLWVAELDAEISSELYDAASLGFTSLIVTIAEWRTMTTQDFAVYKAIIINDPPEEEKGVDPAEIAFLQETADIWGPAITGNIVVIGTDAGQHNSKDPLMVNSIAFAADSKSASGDPQTGFYLSLCQYYYQRAPMTVDALSYFGNFTVRGDFGCYDDVAIVASAPAIKDLTNYFLSGWSCSVHEAFASYPTTGKDGFQALAIANGVSGMGTQSFAQGIYGLPYIISRGATPLGCGDGHWDKDLGEECDDGNTSDFDGCSKSCKCESGLPRGDGTCFLSTSGLVRVPGAFYDGYYFPSVYCSVLITVFFKTLWSIVLASTRMIEPFHQMSKEGGASAKEALLSDYLSSIISKESIKNLFRKYHLVPTLTAAVYGIATITVIVASEYTSIRSGNFCNTPDEPLKCDLQWVIDVKVARALQGLFALTAALILVRIVLGRKRKSGVSSYPCTIASLAALINNPSIIHSFINIDPDTSRKDLAQTLSRQHYALRRYEVSESVSRYGLVQIEAPEVQDWWRAGIFKTKTSKSTKKDEAKPEDTEQIIKKDQKVKPNRSNLKKALILVGIFTAHFVLFAVFLYYRLTNNDSIFVNKVRYGPRMILTLSTVILGFAWSHLESEVRVLTPYRRLAKPKAKAEHILEMSLHGVPTTTFFSALKHGNFFHAWVALVAILSQCLTIGVVGIPYNFGVIQQVSLFSSTACLGILVLMMLTIVFIFVWRRSNPDLPRQPDTIASVIMMLCASKMLKQFEGLDHDLNVHSEIKDRILGQQFRLEKKMGTDNKERIMIDVTEVEPEKIIEPQRPTQATEYGERIVHGTPKFTEEMQRNMQTEIELDTIKHHSITSTHASSEYRPQSVPQYQSSYQSQNQDQQQFQVQPQPQELYSGIQYQSQSQPQPQRQSEVNVQPLRFTTINGNLVYY